MDTLEETARRVNKLLGFNDDSVLLIDNYDMVSPKHWYVLYGDNEPVSGNEVIKRKLSIDRIYRELSEEDYAMFCAGNANIDYFGKPVQFTPKIFYKWFDGVYRNRKEAVDE